ncbi:MAG TPA: dienelactone hydrolase family protein [Candidatus Limnocylindria bacterium]|nr:dienelactone hydrolase family protein [Candidatus Limnocylindria bacterium]
MAGQMVKFQANGDTVDGYLATPPGGKGPGVIVIQEWWGLNDQVKGVADMFAREGFVALAPDFYRGKGAKIGEPDQAQKLMMEFFQANNAAQTARGAASYLSSHAALSGSKVGVIGFCMGGFLAMLVGSVAPDRVAAVVNCYGVGQRMPDLKPMRGIPLLGIFGGKDHSANADAVAGLERAAKEAGVTFTKHVYPDADHAFLNEQRKDVHRPDDAKDAWGKILSFLKSNVRA